MFLLHVQTTLVYNTSSGRFELACTHILRVRGTYIFSNSAKYKKVGNLKAYTSVKFSCLMHEF